MKHFTAYDGPEEGRFSVDAAPPPRDMAATWLAPWRAILRQMGPHPLSGVMASYSAVEGVPICANRRRHLPCLPACPCLPISPLSYRRLLTDALRIDMGFSGWVVSDCGAITNVATKHHYLPNATYAAAAAITAGVDIFCDPEARASRAAAPCTPRCSPMHPTLQPHAPHAAAPCTPRCNPMHYCVELCHLVITPHRPWPSYPRRWLWVCCQAACSTQHFTACSYRSSSWGCTTRTTGGAPVPLAVSPLLCPSPPPTAPLPPPLPTPPPLVTAQQPLRQVR